MTNGSEQDRKHWAQGGWWKTLADGQLRFSPYPLCSVWREHISKPKNGSHSLECDTQRYAWWHRWRWCEAIACYW